MKNIFTFKMIKVAGIVMSVVLGLGAMAPAMAATDFVAGDVKTTFIGGSVEFIGAIPETFNETSEGNWVGATSGTVYTQVQMDANLGSSEWDSSTYDAGTEFALYTQSDVDTSQNADTNATNNSVNALSYLTTQNATAITANANDIDDLETAVSALETSVASNDTDIATNVTAIAANATAVASNLSAIALNTQAIADELLARAAADVTLTAAASAAQSTADAAASAASAAQTAADNAQVSANTANAATGVNATAIIANAAAIGLNAASLVTAASDIITNASAITTNIANIAANTSGVSANVSAIALLVIRVADLETNVSALQTAVGTLVTTVSANVTAIVANTSGVASNVTAIAANTSAIASLVTSVATNATAISDAAAFDLTARGTIQSDVDSNETASDLADTNAAAFDLTARGVIQSDVDSNELASDAADSSATTDRALIRTELATAKTALQAAIDSEIALRASGDAGLLTSLNAEITDRTNEVTRLEGLISALSTSGSSDVGTVQSDVDQNESDSDAADGVHTAAIAANAGSITTNATQIGTNAANIATNVTAISSEVTAREEADTAAALLSSNARDDAATLSSNARDAAALLSSNARDDAALLSLNARNAIQSDVDANEVSSDAADAIHTTDIATNATAIADAILAASTAATTASDASALVQSNLNDEADRVGDFTSVAATAGTPAEAEILASITGTYTHPTTGAVSVFVITLAADGIWYEDGNPRTIATVEGLLDGSITYGGGITNVTGSLVYVGPVDAVDATEGTFAGDGLFGDVAVAITAEQTARMAADAAATTDRAAIRSEFATADTEAAAFDLAARNALQADIDANESASNAADATLRTDFESADATLRTDLAQEVSDRIADVLQEATDRIAAIAAEAQLRVDADDALGVRLDTEKSDRIEADALIQSNVDANEAVSIAADAALNVRADVTAAALVAETVARVKFETSQAIVDAVQNGRLDTIEGILIDHENRISRLEGFHVPADKSFSKVIDGPNGTKIVMHFNADGSMRGKARTLTFLENPIVHGEMDILWNDQGKAVNAITGKLVDANTGLPMADKVVAEAKVVPSYVAAELASDVRFGTSAVVAPVVAMVSEEVVMDVVKPSLSESVSSFFGGMFSSKTEVKAEVEAEVKAPVTTGNPFGK